MKKFRKRDLFEKFGATEEEAKIIMEYQRIFPELLHDGDGCRINTEILWEKLEKPQGRYNMWKDRKVIKIFDEYVDYTTVAQKCAIANGGYQYKDIIFVTIDTAKELAMLTNTPTGKLVRKNFIICEKNS